MTQKTFCPSHCWVPKGRFELVPKRVKKDEAYLKLLREETARAKKEFREYKEASSAAGASASSAGASAEAATDDLEADRIAQAYNLDGYEDEEGEAMDDEDGAQQQGDASGEDSGDDLGDQEDDEDLKLEATDNLIVVALVEPAECLAEAQIHVYNEPNKQFYEHRSLDLNSMPLCFDWIGRGNLLAVGGMEPPVQLWELDKLDAFAPLARLEGHTDAVLDVAWNPMSQQALATASADKRIGLWDLETRRCVRMLSGLHSDKAQALSWHPQEPHLLLTGSYDSTARLVDCRAPPSGEGKSDVPAWRLDGECERLAWDRRNPLFLFAATEKGSVQRCDARKQGSPVSTLAAHSGGSCCGLAVTEHLLCTGGADGLTKLWRVNQNGEWKLLASRDWSVGQVTKVTVNPDCPCVLAITGMAGFRVWDVREDADTRAYLASRGVAIPDA